MNPREIAERIAKDAKGWRVECRGELSTAEDAAFSMIAELANAVKDIAEEQDTEALALNADDVALGRYAARHPDTEAVRVATGGDPASVLLGYLDGLAGES